MRRLKKLFFAFTKSERIAFVAASAASLVSFIVVASILVFGATKVVPAPGGDVTEGLIGQPEYVNPVTAAGEADLALMKLVYDNLYGVAASVLSSTDGRTWTVRLKENLKWQDGQKLTSDDVVFTVQSIQNPDAASPLAASWQGIAVSRMSELEVQFNLANPYAFFGDNLKNLYILPKHLFANIPPGNWRISDYNLKPIGSGPYRFVSYGKQLNGFISSYNLTAWGDYPGAKALIQNFNFLFFENGADLVKSVNAGQVDGTGNIDPASLSAIERPYDLFAWRTPGYYAVFFNQSKSLPLQDAAVRRALSIAVDRDSLVANILLGHGSPEYGPIPEGAPNFTMMSPTASSLDLASGTLDAAGWKMGAAGLRAKMVQRTAVPLAVNLTVPDIAFLKKTAQALADTWAKIGVRVTIATGAPGDIANTTVKNRDYEALLFGNVLGPSSDLFAFWDSSQRFSPGLNLAIYENKKVDKLIEGARENVNAASRAAQFAQAENLIAADYPAIFLYSPEYLYVTNKAVRGISPDFLATPSDLSREAAAWYLNTARVLK